MVGVTAHTRRCRCAWCVLGGAQPVKNRPVGMPARMLIQVKSSQVTLIEGWWGGGGGAARVGGDIYIYIYGRMHAVQLCCRGVRACVVAWHAAREWRMHMYVCLCVYVCVRSTARAVKGRAAPRPTSEHVLFYTNMCHKDVRSRARCARARTGSVRSGTAVCTGTEIFFIYSSQEIYLVWSMVRCGLCSFLVKCLSIRYCIVHSHRPRPRYDTVRTRDK